MPLWYAKRIPSDVMTGMDAAEEIPEHVDPPAVKGRSVKIVQTGCEIDGGGVLVGQIQHQIEVKGL